MLFSCVLIYLLIVGFYFNLYQIYFVFYFVLLFCANLFVLNVLVGWFSLNSVFLFMDSMSFLLYILSCFVVMMVYLLVYLMMDKFFLFLLNFMLLSLFMCFFSSSMLYMYIYFEFSLIPLFLMIVQKGSSMERFSSCVYLLLYTLLSSFLFLSLMSFVKNFQLYFMEVKLLYFFQEKGVLWVLMMLIFLVKLPVFMVHSWLNKAHVEAPVMGSMILAGVLLKLGCFGLYRLFFYMNLYFLVMVTNFLMVFSLLGSVFSCVICMRQLDIKLLIAYSSVSHMGLLLSGMLSLTKMGLMGAIGMMLAHGICSSMLFCLANMFYIRVGSRNFLVMKGLVSYFPALSCFWMIFCLSNMGTPPFFNFMCEILLLLVVFKKSLILMFISVFYLIFVVYYNLILFLRLGHGQSFCLNFMSKESFLEMLLVFCHFVFMSVYLLKSDLVFVSLF
uniref:NADH-ubiquinone oxidoreductase chain 4 n=1 Tax=Euseius sacchari TaxID=3061191 RepID=A0AAU6PCM5_9ACAR